MPVDEKRLRKAYKIIKQGRSRGTTLESFVWSEDGRLILLAVSFLAVTALLITDAVENGLWTSFLFFCS